jgi:cell division protein FtsQ
MWEEDAPAGSRLRRMQKGAPMGAQSLPGMPLDDEDDDVLSRQKGLRAERLRQSRQSRNWPARAKEAPAAPWWRPAGTLGRVSLGLGALTVLGALTTGTILLNHYLDRDPRFRIAGADNIDATGLTEVSRAEMLPVFGEDIGRNIFFIPLAERRKQLEQIPWVERATVMRLLPDQIRVAVVERRPVAFVRQGQQIGLVDADGVLLTMPAAMMAQHHYSFPVVTGIDANEPQLARKARMSVYMRLLGELDANGQQLSEQISEIDLTDPEDARVLMPEPGSDILAHFGEERFMERYQRYKAHIGEWRQQYPKLASVDLRYDSQVVLEMAPGVNAMQPAQPAAAKSPDSAKPPAGQPAQALVAKPAGKSVAKPALSANLEPPAPASKGKGVKTPAKQTPAMRAAALREKKKRAEAKRAALNVSKQKPSPKPHPGTPAAPGQGQ